ncbi:MAG TPA: DUF2795 domain-containing protein [Micromonosporaceae bacterium]|nr:DUF2795 domain-containing protein [Micromonosporaceae bacterium]
MERGNTKHGPRLDEELAHEVRTHTRSRGAGGRVDEWREPEPPGEDQPEVGWIPGGSRDVRAGGAPRDLTPDEVEGRSRLGRYLDLSAFPGDRAALRRSAEGHQAPDDILAELDRLPPDRRFETVNEVWAALGHGVEKQRW